jgi:hypothetical protein
LIRFWDYQIREDDMDGSFSMHDENEKCFKILVERPEGKRSLRRPRHRWEDYIQVYFKEIGWGLWTSFICLRMGNSGGLFWTW